MCVDHVVWKKKKKKEKKKKKKKKKQEKSRIRQKDDFEIGVGQKTFS